MGATSNHTNDKDVEIAKINADVQERMLAFEEKKLAANNELAAKQIDAARQSNEMYMTMMEKSRKESESAYANLIGGNESAHSGASKPQGEFERPPLHAAGTGTGAATLARVGG